jgi:cytochrome c oxidase assembly protein subunit 15
VDESLEDNYPLWLFGLVIVQVFLGVFVRYSNSSLACPDWPLCQGAILPPSFLPEILLHYTHRLVAYIIFGLTLWKLVKAVRPGGGDVKVHAITFALVLLQITFGVLIVLMKMFLPVLVLHGATGFAILGWTAYQAAPGLVSARDIAQA